MKNKGLSYLYSQWLVASMLALSPSFAIAGSDTAADQTKLGNCVACHGADGIGKAPQYPNLQGQKAAYLEKQLKAYKSGDRKDKTMNIMARPLSDNDIADMAAYFANQK